MTILAVVKDVCLMVGVEVPSSVIAGGTANRTTSEMLAHANEIAQRISGDVREWTALKAQATFNGDGTTTAFNLPADYRRMLLTSNVWGSGSTQSPLKFVPDTDEWMQRRAATWANTSGEWTIYGGQMHIFPAMAIGSSATFGYLSRNCVNLSGGGRGETFMNDADTFVLDERLLKLGLITDWKAHKGSPYAEDMATFQDALMMAGGFDKPSPIIIGRVPISSLHAEVAYPYSLTGPDWPLT